MESIPQNLDELIQAGLDAREAQAAAQWHLGDLAVMYAQMEGDKLSLATRNFGGLIGFGQTTTLQQYARVAQFYRNSERGFDVGWTLYRTAMGTALEALSWLEKAEVNGWSDSQLKREIRSSRGEETVELQRCPECGQPIK